MDHVDGHDAVVDAAIPRHCQVEAWDPAVPGVAEVFHAHIVDYSYPLHCHDTWTVLIVDDGAIRFDLDQRERGAAGSTVAIIPPGVVHDGRPAAGADDGFWKRNLYLEADFLPASLVGRAVDQTNLVDAGLRQAIVSTHDGLKIGEDAMHAEERLSLIASRISQHLAGSAPQSTLTEKVIATRLRALLDENISAKFTLQEAAALLDRSVPHLVRSFTSSFGLSPHAYVIGRRVEIARRRLLAGERPAEVAAAVGFHDQAHFSRHFKRHTTVPPGRYAASHSGRN